MGIDFDNITNMSSSELIKLLDEKRKTADTKREEIKKLRSAIESTESKITVSLEEVIYEPVLEENTSTSDFEKEVEFYLSEFLSLKSYDKDSIEEVLPSRNSYNFERIVLRIIAEVTHDIKDINEIIITDSSSMNSDELKEYKDEVLNSNNKINTLKEILFTKIDEETSEESSNKLIFVPIVGTDDVRIFDDIKSIPMEEREPFKGLLDSIKDGSFKNIRRFVNSKLTGTILEVKDYQARILFKRVSSDCYAVISMFVKKTQNDSGYRNHVINRYNEYDAQEKVLKEKIKDEEFIKKNKEFEEAIYKELTKDKSDDKGGVK